MKGVISEKVNKQLLLGVLFIVIGFAGMVDTASAGYFHQYQSNHVYNYGHPLYRDYQLHHKKKYYHRYYHKHHNYHPYRYRHYYGNNHSYKHKHGYYGGYYKPYYSKSYSHSPQPKCVHYRVKSHGGLGGFRFQHDISNFKRINGSYQGSICGRNYLEFELSKLNPSVAVSVEINGQYFSFPAHSGYDKYINNWHRKYYSINLVH